MDHYLIVDGSNLLFQMFYGMSQKIPGRDGRPIQGVLGFLGAILRILRSFHPTHVFVCFDGECYNARKELDADYKANRPDYSNIPQEETPFSQLPDIYAALDYLGICHRETECCEADDWIAAMAKTCAGQGRVTIVSQDSDLFQLISDRVSILRYRGDRSVLCDRAYLSEKLGIAPEQYVDYKSLTGDSSDNIRGAAHIGPKTAAALLQQHGSLETLLCDLDAVTRPSVRASLEACGDRLRLNQKLIRLDGTQSLPVSPEQLAWTYRGQTSTQVLAALHIR